MTNLKITGLDPLLFRDGRPFGAEEGAQSARSLSLPHPYTLAGFVRTYYGNQAGWEWNKTRAEEARKIEVHSPLLLRNEKIVFPAPADAVLYKDEAGGIEKRMSLRPEKNASGGTDLPEGMIPLSVTQDCKPLSGVKYWSQKSMFDWLENASGSDKKTEHYGGLPTENRVSAAINSETGTAKDGMLFSVNRLGFEDYNADLHPGKYKSESGEKMKTKECWSLIARVEASLQAGVGTLGGERGLANVELADEGVWPKCPETLIDKFKTVMRVRMILATPAIFGGGWLPGWLKKEGDALIGTPEGAEVRLKLISAAVGRREPVSGWDFANRCPKPVRWMVPAGSVYFFEVVGDKKLPVENLWLKPVCDIEQDRLDGFGLALWGVWEYSE